MLKSILKVREVVSDPLASVPKPADRIYLENMTEIKYTGQMYMICVHNGREAQLESIYGSYEAVMDREYKLELSERDDVREICELPEESREAALKAFIRRYSFERYGHGTVYWLSLPESQKAIDDDVKSKEEKLREIIREADEAKLQTLGKRPREEEPVVTRVRISGEDKEYEMDLWFSASTKKAWVPDSREKAIMYIDDIGPERRP
jgi:hypothetical protein